MRIVADENMPLVEAFFAGHEIHRLPGRAISRERLLKADALLVRSVTRVDAALLAGTPVRFVGSATIGTDHIDLQALAARGVHVASAPGCNARAVGEYVATALATLADLQGWALSGRSLGVVGLGNTGRQTATLAQALGLRVLGCDPFVQLPGIEQLPFAELLNHADILSLHVPLTREGPHPTFHLVDERVLARLPDSAILINACRGEVVDGGALTAALARRSDLTAVLDVWEGEPCPDPALLARVRVATPHVAGYSLEGKWRGTEMVYRAFCDFFNQPATRTLADVLAAPAPTPIGSGAASPAARLRELLQQACPLGRDDAALRAAQASSDRGAAFDALRKHYPPRREFPAQQVQLPADDPLWPVLQALGFGRA